ncbi:hypothetical protein DBP19_36230 [Streptomyces sp. CS090A]|uniref:hypothetical protein n=1 Tax=Streptomyces sp. CS090A TaxID=2162710 RepID=UPI000D507461|nr:hypothetical protein [Streptomyces sp. CS090A]PVC80588.1 hypothetical protein DBP19_36230 [Streptomyces sp. CS090A]
MTFHAGQRVETTVLAPAAWDGAFSAPAGTPGIIVNESPGGYGVLLDGDPDGLPASYGPDELQPRP